MPFSVKLDFHTFTTQVETIKQSKVKRGRPKKDTVLEIVDEVYREGWVLIDQQRGGGGGGGVFVLVTTLPNERDGKKMGAVKILELYKGQIKMWR